MSKKELSYSSYSEKFSFAWTFSLDSNLPIISPVTVHKHKTKFKILLLKCGKALVTTAASFACTGCCVPYCSELWSMDYWSIWSCSCLNPTSSWTYYLFVAGRKHPNDGNLQKKTLTWAYGCRGISVHHGREEWQQRAAKAAKTKLQKARILYWKHEAKVRHVTLKACPQWCTSARKTVSPKLSQNTPLTEDQMPKTMRTFSCKPLHLSSVSL